MIILKNNNINNSNSNNNNYNSSHTLATENNNIMDVPNWFDTDKKRNY